MSSPSRKIDPSTLTSPIRSFRRLKQRRSVDLPHPEGPMNAVIFRGATSRETAWSARLAPYHSERSFTLRTADSMTGRASVSSADRGSEPPGLTRAPSSESAGRILPAKAIPQGDRQQIHDGHDGDEEERRRVDQRLGGLDVRALEAEVEDVEAEMHELPLEVHEREDAVDGK